MVTVSVRMAVVMLVRVVVVVVVVCMPSVMGVSARGGPRRCTARRRRVGRAQGLTVSGRRIGRGVVQGSVQAGRVQSMIPPEAPQRRST